MREDNPATVARSRRLKTYPTRIDAFRVEARIHPATWAMAAGMAATTLMRIRSGRDIRVDALARLVRAARKVTVSAVKASDLYDLGEIEPAKNQTDRRIYRTDIENRNFYDTPLDRLLVHFGLKPAAVARRAGITRQTLNRLRSGVELPRVSTLAAVVDALRLMTGKAVVASDIYDVGEVDPWIPAY